MNLHAIASSAISAVNPSMSAQLFFSTGDATDANFKRVPSYAPAQGVTAQVQPLSYSDMRQLDGVNLGGQAKAMYLNGTLDSVVRVTQKGGDLVTLQDGTQWLTVQVLEDYSATAGWVKVAVKRQQAS